MATRLTIVTGASANHERSLIQFLRSLEPQNPDQMGVYVWNFGLTDQTCSLIQQEFPWAVMETFNFAAYPAFFDITVNAGEYAWKSAAILETVRRHEIVKAGLLLWCDAGNLVRGALIDEQMIIESQGIYSPISSGTVQQWTHPRTLDYLMVPDTSPLLMKSPRNGAIYGFDLRKPVVMRFLEEFTDCCRQKACIAPPGSNRDNHRQDQAVFTILYYRFFEIQGMATTESKQFGITTHNDCDGV